LIPLVSFRFGSFSLSFPFPRTRLSGHFRWGNFPSSADRRRLPVSTVPFTDPQNYSHAFTPFFFFTDVALPSSLVVKDVDVLASFSPTGPVALLVFFFSRFFSLTGPGPCAAEVSCWGALCEFVICLPVEPPFSFLFPVFLEKCQPVSC